LSRFIIEAGNKYIYFAEYKLSSFMN